MVKFPLLPADRFSKALTSYAELYSMIYKHPVSVVAVLNGFFLLGLLRHNHIGSELALRVNPCDIVPMMPVQIMLIDRKI